MSFFPSVTKSTPAVVLTAALLSTACPAGAKDDAPTWAVHGFGSFGASGTDTNQIAFRRDTTQANGVTRSGGIDTDSRLGLQLDVDFNQSWHAGVQWVARNHAGDFFEQNLDWAYLRWRPVDDLDIRIGRLGLDLFMLSDYRNVGYTYPWIRPPHEFYGNLLIYHFDGIDIAKKIAVGEGYLTLKAGGGYSFVQLGGNSNNEYTMEGASLVYEQGDWRARIGYGHVKSVNEVLPQANIDALASPATNAVWPGASSLIGKLGTQGKEVHYSSIGLSFDDGVWLAQTEGAYVNANYATYLSSASGYLSVGRRVAKFTPFLLLGISETLRGRVNIPEPLLPIPEVIAMRNAVDNVLNNYGVDEKSVSLGLRWDVYQNIALKAQWSHFWLGNNGAGLWVIQTSGPTPNNVDVWSAGVDFMF
jgi:hypothetical protein